MRESKIKHILMRHEQGAAHAADGYARASASIGVCAATGGPGALNLIMGVATAYKDSVPLIVITGDVPRDMKGKKGFQDIDIGAVFKPITLKSFDIKNPEEGILTLKNAIETLKYNKKGPIHLNFPKDVLESYVDEIDYWNQLNVRMKSTKQKLILKHCIMLLNCSKTLKNPLYLQEQELYGHKHQIL